MFEEVPYYILVFSQHDIRVATLPFCVAVVVTGLRAAFNGSIFRDVDTLEKRKQRGRVVSSSSDCRFSAGYLPLKNLQRSYFGFSQPLWTSRSLQYCGGQRQDVRFSTPGARSCGYTQGHVGVVRCTVGALLSWEEGRMWLHQDQQKLVLSQWHSIFPAI